jgi:hypothetical protein
MLSPFTSPAPLTDQPERSSALLPFSTKPLLPFRLPRAKLACHGQMSAGSNGSSSIPPRLIRNPIVY